MKTGYSKNIMAHGICRIYDRICSKYVIATITLIKRPDGTQYYAEGELALVNKDEVSNIKEGI